MTHFIILTLNFDHYNLADDHFESSNDTTAASYLYTAGCVQLFEYFIEFYVITYKMSGKWESDKNLTSHKPNFFEAKLEMITMLQMTNLEIHYIHCS